MKSARHIRVINLVEISLINFILLLIVLLSFLFFFDETCNEKFHCLKVNTKFQLN